MWSDSCGSGSPAGSRRTEDGCLDRETEAAPIPLRGSSHLWFCAATLLLCADGLGFGKANLIGARLDCVKGLPRPSRFCPFLKAAKTLPQGNTSRNCLCMDWQGERLMQIFIMVL